MQQIITQIKNAGKKAYLAKAPYAKGNYTGRNSLIQKYNQVIDELITENGITIKVDGTQTFRSMHRISILSSLTTRPSIPMTCIRTAPAISRWATSGLTSSCLDQ